MKTIRIAIIISLFISFTGCSEDEFFELERPPQAPWLTLAELERAPIGVYATLFRGADWGTAMADIAILKVQTGDDVGNVDEDFGYARNSKEFIEYTDRPWHVIYRAIAGANDALSFIEQNGGYPFGGLTAIDSMNVRRITGELHFARGYAYYLLQTTYGHAYVPGGDNSTQDIPLITSFASSAEETFSPEIGTTEEVYDQIVIDFARAKELLPEQFDGSTMPAAYEVRANKFAAAAMLAKTYFQMGDYENTLRELNFVIDENNGAYDLTEDPIEAWNKSSVARGSEVIFYVPHFDLTDHYPEIYSVINQTLRGASQCGFAQARLQHDFIVKRGWMNDPTSSTDTAIFVAARADKRFTQLFEVRYPWQLALPAGLNYDTRPAIREMTTIFPNKYYRGPEGPHTNIPYIRLAEMHLTRSVLRLRDGDADGAAADLNIVRRRAWDENVGGPFVEVLPGEITEEMIGEERILEMYAENDRIDYLRALKLPIGPGERTDVDGNPLPDEPYTSERFVWAIPQHETNYNLNLQ